MLDARPSPSTDIVEKPAVDIQLEYLRQWTASLEEPNALQEISPPVLDNKGGEEREHLSDADLHRKTRSAVVAADGAVFGNLANLIGDVIDRKLWLSRGFPSFAKYAIANGTGLGISSNQKIYLLRAVLDVHAKHIRLWAEILQEVDSLVRIAARERGTQINTLKGKTLRALAKDRASADALSYLPSCRSGPGCLDGALMRLHRTRPDLYERVCSGTLSVTEARRLKDPVRKPDDEPSKMGPSAFYRLRKQIVMLGPSCTAAEKQQLAQLILA